ncbi:Asp23/Gls24 family envelope stress response protein [Atopobacter sp. AH10]|uniref:Asp23/Gls24 family envelope stress response protein n=1 Tax=Atopobacter sp. AH10 TaxID=2315861 RepID=UPI000EF259BA|nr:Asp23/Gls24 family envelope stress response protein [Atopobacter sp. AH10]RLK63296.1 Asp23/Gls24 family envelope stress response protein [Atopobacter sp. AH10]
MAVKIESKYGIIDLDNEVIATVVGVAATDNYGVIGMASKNQLKDGISELLKLDNYSRGVTIHQEGESIIVSVAIFVLYGTKISEICKNVQQQVKYDLETILGITADKVNVQVQGVRDSESLA